MAQENIDIKICDAKFIKKLEEKQRMIDKYGSMLKSKHGVSAYSHYK